MFQIFNRAPLWEMPDNIRPHFLVYSNIFSYISHDMDPISGVASVVAIISLAVQLGECAIKAKGFLDAISYSSSEVLRLRRIVDQSHLIADSVRKVLETDRQQRKGSQQYSESVYTSLAMCLDIVGHIESITSKAKKVHQEKRPLSRAWAQFRMACKQGYIETLERKFYGSIAILNVTLSLRPG